MTAEIVELGNLTRLNIPVERVLENAKEEISEDGVVLIGWDKDGDLYFASSIASGPDVLWLLEKAKIALLESGSAS